MEANSRSGAEPEFIGGLSRDHSNSPAASQSPIPISRERERAFFAEIDCNDQILAVEIHPWLL
jgi:hypothetical protein